MRVEVAGCEGIGFDGAGEKSCQGWELSVDGRWVTEDGIEERRCFGRRGCLGLYEGFEEGCCCFDVAFWVFQRVRSWARWGPLQLEPGDFLAWPQSKAEPA